MEMTAVPNYILDNYMDKLNGNEFKVFMLIIRKVIGWGKTKDGISLSQICESTGMSKNTVIKSLETLIDMDLIEKEYSQRANGGNNYNYYSLSKNLLNECNTLVQKMNKPSAKNEQGLVQKMNTQKKLETKETKTKEEKNTKKSFDLDEIISELDSKYFTDLEEMKYPLNKEMFEEWNTFRSEIKKPNTETSVKQQVKLLCKYPVDIQKVMIETSINAGYQGLFAPKQSQGFTQHKSKTQMRNENIDRIIDEINQEKDTKFDYEGEIIE